MCHCTTWCLLGLSLSQSLLATNSLIETHQILSCVSSVFTQHQTKLPTTLSTSLNCSTLDQFSWKRGNLVKYSGFVKIINCINAFNRIKFLTNKNQFKLIQQHANKSNYAARGAPFIINPIYNSCN